MPGLNRILLINTHLQGVVELKVDAHTNICGTNASGKTTLQRLVPVFYGEYPSRVVPATRDSFERWYLPTEQSFIIYEYQRMDEQICQAVLAAASDGKGVVYRLVQRPFDLDDYSRARQGDRLTCISMKELGLRLRQLGVPTTRLLNTREYRAILQNDRALFAASSNAGELRALGRQYSLCQPRQSLRHLEKLARAVHSREGKMETVRSMIAAILEEDGVSPPTSQLKLKQVEDWIRESRLIQGFEAMRPEFDRLERAYQELLVRERRLSGLKQSYRLEEPLEQQRLAEARARVEHNDRALKRLKQAWDNDSHAFDRERSSSKGEIERCETELNQIEQQYRTYLDADIEQIKADLERLGDWREDRESLKERLRLLTDTHQDVERDYLERQHRIGQRRERQLEELRQRDNDLKEGKARLLEQHNAAVDTLREQQRNEREVGLADFRQRKSDCELERERLKTRLENAAHTEEERHELAVFDQRLETADAEIEEIETRLTQLDAQHQEQRRQRDAADTALRKIRRQREERQGAVDDAQRLLYPGQHSLLEFLRRERPGWETCLGKVLDPALLQRTDLKPQPTEDDPDSFGGLRLDLKAIDTPAHAVSEQALRQHLQNAEDALNDVDNRLREAESRLDQTQTALVAHEREQTLAQGERRARREDLSRLKEERRTLKGRFDAALSERQLHDRKALSDLDARLQRLTKDQEHWAADLSDRHHEALSELKTHWQDVIGRTDTEIAQNQGAIEERKRKAKEELDACEHWYRNELKSRGVDDTLIADLKRQMDDLEKRIQRTEGRRAYIQDYDNWYQRTWLGRKPELQTRLDEERGRAARLDREFATAEEAFKRARAELQAALKGANDQAEATEASLTRLKSQRRRLDALKLPPEEPPPAGDLGERLRLGEDLLQGREQLLIEVRNQVEHFDRLIAANAGSSLAETWERSRADCRLPGEPGSPPALDHRRLVEQLAQLLNELVPQKLTGLREQGRIFGKDLADYYVVLDDIDRRIENQSRRITREVAEDLSLDGVSDSAVLIRSRISELEFWPDLRAFITAFEDWRDSGFDGLPNADYVNSMRQALEIIGRSAPSGGVAGLLEIELRLREGRSDLVIRTDRQLNESSSHGMAYLILCKFLLAFTRLLRADASVVVHWPIDELGTLHHQNVKKIFDACDANAIRILGAFPNPESEVLGLFTNRYIVDRQTRQLQVVKPRIDAIAARLQQRQDQGQEACANVVD